eukprot:CAMPEP_0116830978 /NCGR_PEP_ID=MMETSP0418-20121206/5072_1 /TAXON_ID=1158023 /ORGANISM="Astrosyne radiata, Strain 13vi08-1A" /LENGTH=375 /DNA_ID=CAMNT_0004460159 /DNA_START=280 /DNA_END=1407 /DNA_ORIENTATION=+
MLQASTALNVGLYLLLKMEHANQEVMEDNDDENTPSPLASHPVMSRLRQWNDLDQKLFDQVESKVPGLAAQMDTLVKATALLDKKNEDEKEEDDDYDDDDPSEAEAEDNDSSDQPMLEAKMKPFEEEESSDDEDVRDVWKESKFALRPSEVQSDIKQSDIKQPSRRRRAAPSSDFGTSDFGDVASANTSKSLASTMNTLEQKSQKRKQKRQAPVEDIDGLDDGDDNLKRGLEMMEAKLGQMESDNEEEDEHGMEDDEKDDTETNDFYNLVAKISRAKKDTRKSLHKVAPKFPRREEEVEGERAISKTILKNRGLVAHKNKLNRNPRVKKREQYRKALIRRKGKVREVRTGEGHRYGGEETGIKTRLSRSRKLGVR